MAGVLAAFTADVLRNFTVGVSGVFTAIAALSTMIVLTTIVSGIIASTMIVISLPVPVTTGTRGGGIGVIIPITLITISKAR